VAQLDTNSNRLPIIGLNYLCKLLKTLSAKLKAGFISDNAQDIVVQVGLTRCPTPTPPFD